MWVEWAEEVGLGELGLMPAQFWSLTYREFLLKHAAFIRAEDRMESVMVRQALRLGQYEDSKRAQMNRHANALKRYPIKPWLE